MGLEEEWGWACGRVFIGREILRHRRGRLLAAWAPGVLSRNLWAVELKTWTWLRMELGSDERVAEGPQRLEGAEAMASVRDAPEAANPCSGDKEWQEASDRTRYTCPGKYFSVEE